MKTHPGVYTFIKQQIPPPRDDGRAGMTRSLECQLMSNEKKYFAFIRQVVVEFMNWITDV